MFAMTKQTIIKKLKARQGGDSLRSLAKRIPCSPAYLSDIYSGRREPGKKVLDFLGIQKSVKVSRTYAFSLRG